MLTMQRAVALFSLLALGACSSTNDPPPSYDSGQRDGAVVDASSLPSALQAVVSTFTLPTQGNDYAVDLDGDGVGDNHVGRILAALSSANPVLDLQTQLDTQMAAGNLLLLLELRTEAINATGPAELAAYFGVDLDGDPTNNFSGSATLAVDTSGPGALRLSGSIASGQLSVGPGQLTLPIPIGETAAHVTTRLTQMVAQVSGSGIEGVVAGAITVADMENIVVPTIAKEMDRQYKSGNATPTGIAFIRDNFDLDRDGNVTVPEVLDNPIMGLLLKTADVDIDGDSIKDGMSIALAFKAVLCTIQR